MPTPNKGEKQSEYVSRCVEFVMKNGEATDNKQAAAICYSKWQKSKASELVTALTGRCSSCGKKIENDKEHECEEKRTE
jgi:hypothetical protein